MNSMVTALEITALGMGLVFAAIVLLWWVMDLLTWITAEKEPASPAEAISGPTDAAPITNGDLRAKAAAVAVAIALAQQQVSSFHPLCEPPTAIVSAWQLGTRTRQLYEKGTSIVRKPRKIG
jgi:Na+-transporting methylmalonyl-CoA/oxaloacetate decarboxylase gamma subunit